MPSQDARPDASRRQNRTLNWLRFNLGLITLALTLLSTIAGGMIGGGVWIARNEARIGEMKSRIDAIDTNGTTKAAGSGQATELREAILQSKIADMDARGTAGLADTRRQIDQGQAQLAQRIAVLELQTKVIAEYIHDTQVSSMQQQRTLKR